MKDLNFKVKRKEYYGRTNYYPVCEQGKLFLEIMNRSTCFTKQDLLLLKKIDVQVELMQEVI